MNLFSNDNREGLNSCSSFILDAVNNAANQFYQWKAEHPDADTAELEREIADTIWALLKIDHRLAIVTANAPDFSDFDEDDDAAEDDS